MKTKTIEFRLVQENTVFVIGEDTFVKRPFSNGYNAFNIDTGIPFYVYDRTICEIEEAHNENQ